MTTLNMVNDPLGCGKNINLLRYFLNINKGSNHILGVDDDKNNDGHGKEIKIYESIFHNILYKGRGSILPIKDNFHILYVTFSWK